MASCHSPLSSDTNGASHYLEQALKREQDAFRKMGMKRELNELEFLTWTMGEPGNAALSCRFSGVASLDAMQAALDKTQERHPLLRTKIIVDERGVPWLTSEDVHPIQPVVIEREGDDHVLRVMEREMAKAHQKPPLPLMRFLWLRPKEASVEPSDIIICGPHFLGDAVSHIYFFRDLFQFLVDPGREVSPIIGGVEQDSLLPLEIQKKMPKTATRFKLWLKFLKFFNKTHSSCPENVPTVACFSFKTSSRQLSKDSTAALISRCKHEHVTVQAAICTAFSSMFHMIYSPVNIRDRLRVPVGEAIGMFATGSNVRMRYNARRSFWENARAYQGKMNKSTRDQYLLFIYTLINKAVPLGLIRQFWAIFSGLEDTKRLAITNWGVLEKLGMLPAMGGFRVETFYGGVSAQVNTIVIFIHTLDGKMHFQPIHNEKAVPVQKVEKILVDAIKLLERSLD